MTKFGKKEEKRKEKPTLVDQGVLVPVEEPVLLKVGPGEPVPGLQEHGAVTDVVPEDIAVACDDKQQDEDQGQEQQEQRGVGQHQSISQLVCAVNQHQAVFAVLPSIAICVWYYLAQNAKCF